MMETVLDVPSHEIITQENAMVGMDGVVLKIEVVDDARAARRRVGTAHRITMPYDRPKARVVPPYDAFPARYVAIWGTIC